MTTQAAHRHLSHEPVALRTYFLIFAVLLGLLAITVGLAFLPAKGRWRDLLTTVGFLIAGTKALLIILWFMHVKQSTRLILIVAVAGFFWLGIMFTLGMSDYLTRNTTPGAEKPEPVVTSTRIERM